MPMLPALGKKKIAARVSGCTRWSRRSGRNLANWDATYHGTGHPNAATTVVCIWTQRARVPCVGTRLLWHIRSGRHMSRYHMFRRSCQDAMHSDIAVKTQCVQTQLSMHNASRCSCQCTTCPDAAATAYIFWTSSVMAIALRTQCVSYRHRELRQISSGRYMLQHLLSR